MSSGTDWTDEDVETIKRMAKEGNSASVIGRKVGRTRNSIIGKLKRTNGRLPGQNPLPRSRKAAPPKPPRPMQKDPDTTCPRVSIMALNDRVCRWPLGDPLDPEFAYCGRTKPTNGRPYCETHTARAWRGGGEKPEAPTMWRPPLPVAVRVQIAKAQAKNRR